MCHLTLALLSLMDPHDDTTHTSDDHAERDHAWRRAPCHNIFPDRPGGRRRRRRSLLTRNFSSSKGNIFALPGILVRRSADVRSTKVDGRTASPYRRSLMGRNKGKARMSSSSASCSSTGNAGPVWLAFVGSVVC